MRFIIIDFAERSEELRSGPAEFHLLLFVHSDHGDGSVMICSYQHIQIVPNTIRALCATASTWIHSRRATEEDHFSKFFTTDTGICWYRYLGLHHLFNDYSCTHVQDGGHIANFEILVTVHFNICVGLDKFRKQDCMIVISH